MQRGACQNSYFFMSKVFLCNVDIYFDTSEMGDSFGAFCLSGSKFIPGSGRIRVVSFVCLFACFLVRKCFVLRNIKRFKIVTHVVKGY